MAFLAAAEYHATPRLELISFSAPSNWHLEDSAAALAMRSSPSRARHDAVSQTRPRPLKSASPQRSAAYLAGTALLVELQSLALPKSCIERSVVASYSLGLIDAVVLTEPNDPFRIPHREGKGSSGEENAETSDAPS